MLSNFSALIGEFVIPRLGVVDIEVLGTGYRIRGHVDNEEDKLKVLHHLGPIRRGRVERAKFVTREGTLVNESFVVTESRFEEEQLQDHRRFIFTILLEQPSARIETRN
jgi:hypothetical protein